MKKILTAILILVAFAATSQAFERVTVWDSTRIDGQRFIISYPYQDVLIRLVDSVTQVNDSTWAVEPGYISVANSKATFRAMRIRIIDGDTLSRGELITVPLNKIGNNAYQFLVGNPTKREIRKSTKKWINRKLNQE